MLYFFCAGVFSTVRKVLRMEGVEGLFKGNGAQMVRIFPYAATQFASYEYYKEVSCFHLGAKVK